VAFTKKQSSRRSRAPSPLAEIAKRLGISALRPGQQEVIESVLAHRNTLAIMPTGAGKSFCYQLPALYLPGITVIVSPLISLMQDQAQKLQDAGVEAAQLNSAFSAGEQERAMHDIARAASEFVFTTPERLSDPEFMETLKRNHIDLLVVDEAHCISQWGHDFRPAFLDIRAAREALGNPPVLALTATATSEVIDDIRKQLGTPDMQVINTGVYRQNLQYQVVHAVSEEEKLARVRQLTQSTRGSLIVYTATVKAAEAVFEMLSEAGEAVTRYHGRLPTKERTRNQEQFMSGEARVMVASNAFGMGIDKPDIRGVIHYQMPGSIESYYQESGRAGRDNDPAACTLIYHLADRRVHQFFMAKRYPSADELWQVYCALMADEPGPVEISFEALGEALPALAANKLRVALHLLDDAEIVSSGAGHAYRLVKRGLKLEDMEETVRPYRERSDQDREKLERMVFYAQTGMCRWKVLLTYFGDSVEWTRCGTCDNCLRPPPEPPPPPRKEQIVTLRAEESRFHSGDAVRVAKFGEGRVVQVAGERVTIQFPDSAKRTFLSDYVSPMNEQGSDRVGAA
jgi:ATP-dependent DNA helicase RecQ